MTTFTPREIKNRKFKQSLMGADAEEVKDFLKIVAAEFDRILTQNALLEKRLTEQTVRSTLGTKKEAEKQRQTLESADKAAGEIIARAREEADGIRQQTERDLAELRRKTEREAHEKARRETALMLSQAKVMADEVILNAKQKAEKIEAEAKEALAAAAASVPDFERPLSIPPSPGEGAFGSDEAEDLSSEEALQNFDSLIAEARVKAETIIQTTRAGAEMVTSGLIGRTLGELNKEHERLLAAVQNAVHKSEEIVKAAREEAEQFAVRRKSDAFEECNAVLLEAERKAGVILSRLRSRRPSHGIKPGVEGKTAGSGGKTSPKYQ